MASANAKSKSCFLFQKKSEGFNASPVGEPMMLTKLSDRLTPQHPQVSNGGDILYSVQFSSERSQDF